MISEWMPYLDSDKKQKLYRCPVCNTWNGHLNKRRTKASEEEYVEYQIQCSYCGNKSSVHRSKSLAERVFAASGGFKE